MPVYCRVLSPEQFGVLDLLLVFVTIASTAAVLELPNGLFRYYFEQDTPERKNRLVESAVFWCMGSSLMILAIVSIFSERISFWLFNDSNLGYLLKLAAMFVVLDSIKTIPLNLLRIQDKPMKYAVISAIQIIVYILSVLTFMIGFGLAVEGILLAKLVSEFVALIYSFRFSRLDWRLNFDWPLLRSVMAFSIPMIPAGMAIWGINSLNRLFLLKSAGMQQVGLFAMGSKFVVVLILTNIAFQLAWPQYAFNNMRLPNFREITGKIFSIFFAVVLWLAVFLGVFGELLIKLVATPAFFDAAEVIFPLALGMVAYGLFYIFATGALIEKKTFKLLPAVIGALFSNVLANSLLTPEYGFVGTAWATVITYATMAGAMFFISRSWKYIEFDMRAILTLLMVNTLALMFGGILIKFGGVANYFLAGAMLLVIPLILLKSGAVSSELISAALSFKSFSQQESISQESTFAREKEPA